MKAVFRYIISLSFFTAFFLSCIYYFSTSQLSENDYIEKAESYLNPSEIFSIFQSAVETEEFQISKCSVPLCFNLSQCLSQKEFKVYVYPTSNLSVTSFTYFNILKVLRESSYYTNDYRKACIFILGIDTTDRDRRSENFVGHMNELIHSLPVEIWNEGRNHIIFNLYHGTFPDYSDHDLGFDAGYAMIARASANAQVFRHNFDLSFPLFHKEHPLRTSVEPVWPLNLKDRHIVSFKGKRYVYGIGSETRDSLYHLHNGKSSVMVTTCKHNNDWKKYEDQRCEEDNAEYEKWNYEEVMSNSTFCLTPRGRRLGSFRFLEALRLGCIPVVLSDDWVLPFSEIIDWSQAAVIAHEDSVLPIIDVLNAIPLGKILYMKQQARGLYQRYFSSVEKIMITSIEILEERMNKQKGIAARNWDLESHEKIPSFSVPDFGYKEVTVILQATAKVSGRLNRHIQTLFQLSFVREVFVFWPTSRGIPPENTLTSKGRRISYIVASSSDQSVLFSLLHTYQTRLAGEWLLFLDERASLSKREAILLYEIALSEPERLTTVYSAVHKKVGNSWLVDVVSSDERSISLLHLFFLKRIFLVRFWRWVPHPAIVIAQKIPQCFTLLLNFMMAEISFRSPVFISNRKFEPWTQNRNYTICLNELVSNVWLSGPSLVVSRTRIDSIFSKQKAQLTVA